MDPYTCPICGSRGSIPEKDLYDHDVCVKCYWSFIGRRLLAGLIDFSIVIAVIVIGSDILNTDIFLIMLIPLLLKDGFQGHSPGKAATGLQVIDKLEGDPINFGKSFARNLPFLIPFGPIFIVIQLCISKGYRVGDGWVNTKVIWEKYRNAPPFIPLAKAVSEAISIQDEDTKDISTNDRTTTKVEGNGADTIAKYRKQSDRRNGMKEPSEDGHAIIDHCPKCGICIDQNWKFCPNCATQLLLPVLKCENCKHELQSDWKACPYCGTKR